MKGDRGKPAGRAILGLLDLKVQPGRMERTAILGLLGLRVQPGRMEIQVLPAPMALRAPKEIKAFKAPLALA